MHIIYLSENGETKVIEHTLDFMDFIDDNNIKPDLITKYKIYVVNIDTKILNERKVNACVTLKICFEFFEKQDIEYLKDLGQMSGVEKLQESVELNTVVAIGSVKSSLKDDINVEGDDIQDILKLDVSVTNIENKISYNKVLAKADANVKILYITESNKVSTFSTTVPIMNFIDMENVNDENSCNIEYKVRNMRCSKSNYQVDFEVFCEVYKKQEIEIVQDMYGINKKVTFNQRSVEIQTEGNIEREKVNIAENILIEDIRGIYDVDCMAKMSSVKEGELIANIYFDTGNNLGVKTAKIPFIVNSEYDLNDVQISVVSKSFKLIGENVAVDAELEISKNSSNFRNVKLIDDIQEEEVQDNNDYAMIVYFVKEGDTIWNIARDFRVTQNSIIENNNLQERQEIHTGEKLYIMK